MSLPALKRYRTKHNLSQTALGKELGVSHVTISRWETGERFPRRKQLDHIVKTLGIPIGVLVSPGRESVR